MATTKYFELTENDGVSTLMLLKFLADRCLGLAKDPDTEEDWTGYKNITFSIVRSAKNMPEAMNNHNVVSGYVYKFSVVEFGGAAFSPKVTEMVEAVKKLPIRRCSSHFFLKVDLDD